MSSPVTYQTTFPSLKDTETVAGATRRMLESRVSDLPVVARDTGKLVGMVSARDVLIALREGGGM